MFAYVFTGLFGWLTILLEDARWPGMWKTVLLFPLHLGIWWVLMLVALFYRDATWHDIPHTVRLSLSEIEAEHHTGHEDTDDGRAPAVGHRSPEGRTDTDRHEIQPQRDRGGCHGGSCTSRRQFMPGHQIA